MYCITRIISIRVRPVHIEWFPFSTLQLMSVSRNDKWKHGRTLLGLQVNWLKLCTKKKKLYNKAKKSGLQNDWKVYPVVSWKSKTVLEFCFICAQRIKRTYSTESGWCDPDGWPGDCEMKIIFQLCLLQKIMEISLSIVISWIPSYQLSFALQTRFLAFCEILIHTSPRGLTTSRRLKSLWPFVHFWTGLFSLAKYRTLGR